jgi:hypothetical protein
MRVVGQPGRYSPTPTPEQAFLRGLALDAAEPRLETRPRRVQRLRHAEMNRQDDERMLARARRINSAPQQ